MPVYFANFVLMDYGFGAIFGCPAHDQRDLDFAIKYNLEVLTVVKPEGENDSFKVTKKAYTDSGIIFNSEILNNLPEIEKLGLWFRGSQNFRGVTWKTFNRLKELRLHGNLRQSAKGFISKCPELEFLEIGGCTDIKPFDFIHNTPKLKWLEVGEGYDYDENWIKDLSGIEKAKNLKTFFREMCSVVLF